MYQVGELVQRGMVMGLGASLQISTVDAYPKGVQLEEPHTGLRDAPGEDGLAGLPRSWQHRHLPLCLEKKREDPRSLRTPQSVWQPEGEEPQQDKEMGAPRMGISLENSVEGPGEGAKCAQRKVVGTDGEGREFLLSAEGQRKTKGSHEGEAEWGHVQRLWVSSPRETDRYREQTGTETIEDAMSGSRWEWEVPNIPGEPQVLQGLGTKEGSITEKPQEQKGMTGVTRREEQAEVALQDTVKVRAVEFCTCLFSPLTTGPQIGIFMVSWGPFQLTDEYLLASTGLLFEDIF